MVLKPETVDHSSGPIRPIGSGSNIIEIRPFEPAVRPTNWMNWSVPF